MKVIDTKFKGLKIIQQKRNVDNRGNLREIFRKNIVKWDKLVFDYATLSKSKVLRGFPASRTLVRSHFGICPVHNKLSNSLSAFAQPSFESATTIVVSVG